jgi:hypothetical protein
MSVQWRAPRSARETWLPGPSERQGAGFSRREPDGEASADDPRATPPPGRREQGPPAPPARQPLEVSIWRAEEHAPVARLRDGRVRGADC